MTLIFTFTLLCGASERFYLFEAPKRSVKIKKIMSFSPLIPLGQQGLRLRFVELPTNAISVSLTIKIHKNNLTPSELLTNSTIK